MQTPPLIPRRRHPWRAVLAWCLAACLAALACLGFCLWSVLTPPRELLVLRGALGGDAPAVVRLDLGRVSTFVLRGAAGLAPDLPAEGRAAVAALRRAGVVVCRGLPPGAADDGRAAWARAEAEMARLGWSRVVLVAQRERQEQVLVWADEEAARRGELSVCVAVRNGGELVLVRADLEPEALAGLVSLPGPEGGGLLRAPRS